VTDTAIHLDAVTVGYGRHTVLRSLSLDVARGELVGVVGPSGSGKTTLLRLLTGQADRHAGVVRVLGRDLPAGRAPAHVGYVPQLGTIDPDFPLTVEQVVLQGAVATSPWVPWYPSRERRHARSLLDRLGLAGLHDRRIRELSGGQQQRMLLARALVREAELLLLDEPTSGVDLATRRDVLHVLGDLHADGLTIVLSTHDLNFVATHLPRIVCLQGGVVADGAPAEVLRPDVLERTYGAPMRVVHDGERVVVLDETPLLGSGRP
jgi:ABC-type Mn2+/Zn2+ transport system ATPase subunit